MATEGNRSSTETAVDSVLLNRFCRSIGEIQWLLVILVLLYLVLTDVPARGSPTVLTTIAVYFVFSISASYVTVMDVGRRFLIALHTLVMMAFITVIIYKTNGLDGPLVGLYLLPIITSALALGKLSTLLEIGAVASCYGLLICYSQPHIGLHTYEWSAPIANLLMFLLVGYLTTTLADAIHEAKTHLQKLPHLEQGMAATLRRWKYVTDRSTDAFIEMDSGGRVTEWNSSAQSLFGWSAEEACGRAMSELIIPEQYRAAHDAGLARFLESGENKVFDKRIELEALDRNGQVFPVELLIHDVKMPDQWYFDAFMHDISKRSEQHSKLERQAYIDPVTQLANRHALDKRLAAVLERSAANNPPLLVMIDLDDFKSINDQHGHDAGDSLLVQVGQRLRETVRERDLVARHGGDEFVILMDGSNNDDPEFRQQIAHKLGAALSRPYLLGNSQVTVTASIGMAVPDAETSDAMTLFRRADKAMYEAKHGGKNQYRIATDERAIA